MLLIVVPRGLGSWLLGPIWRSTYPLLLPQMLTVIGVGIGFGVGTGLHAHGASRQSLRQAVLVAGLYVTGSLVGALAGGATGTVWGGLAAPWIGAVVGWWQLHAVQRESGHLPAGRRFSPFHHRKPTARRHPSPGACVAPRPRPSHHGLISWYWEAQRGLIRCQRRASPIPQSWCRQYQHSRLDEKRSAQLRRGCCSPQAAWRFWRRFPSPGGRWPGT